MTKPSINIPHASLNCSTQHFLPSECVCPSKLIKRAIKSFYPLKVVRFSSSSNIKTNLLGDKILLCPRGLVTARPGNGDGGYRRPRPFKERIRIFRIPYVSSDFLPNLFSLSLSLFYSFHLSFILMVYPSFLSSLSFFLSLFIHSIFHVW